jgi:hypothetical protein
MPTASFDILKNVHQEIIIKLAGDDTEEAIPVAFLQAAGQVASGTTQTVNIVGVTWSGASGSVITIERNNVIIMTLQGNCPNQLDFSGELMVPDSVNNTSDFIVTISGGYAECYLKLRKVFGYQTTIEPEQFGPYDDPNTSPFSSGVFLGGGAGGTGGGGVIGTPIP